MQSIVALDIETTGLDPDRDEIIEVAAVRFHGNRVEGEWETLINPRRRIPPEITHLTGITSEMIVNAPVFAEVAGSLAEFVGDSPILGHSVNFDLGFLQRRGHFLYHTSLDTFDLAAVMLPTARRYNLSAIALELGIPFQARHRALEDARLAHAVFHNLYQQALGLPIEILDEIVRLGDQIDWGAGWIFDKAFREVSKKGIQSRKVPRRASGAGDGIFPGDRFPIQPLADGASLDPMEIAAVLEHGGAFAKYSPGYEFRPQQVEMLVSVTDALSRRRHLMVEAGTGTGKSLAYLIPAAIWSVENNTRVVVSTNTINLQEQLITKDIPDVRNTLGLDLRPAVLKGRSNYLCPRRLDAFRRAYPESKAEMRVLAKVLVWLSTNPTGDRAELNLSGPAEELAWARLSAADEGCTNETCLRRMGGICPFYQAHQTAEQAHLIVVNHALLLADMATGNRVLPEYNYLVVDEAHHLEAATTSALSFRISETDIERLMRELGGRNAGMLGRMISSFADTLPPGDFAYIQEQVEEANDRGFQFQNQAQNFFIALQSFLAEQREGREVGRYGQKERILGSTRSQPGWGAVEVSWDEAQLHLAGLMETLERLAIALSNLVDAGMEEAEALYGDITAIYRRLGEIFEKLNGLAFEPSPNLIYWVEISPNGGRLSLQAAPLHIGPLMQTHLWHQKESVILTSATLTAANEFDYLRNRLNADDVDELALGSPFDYETAALLYLANDIPEPFEKSAYQRAVNQCLINLAKEIGGRTLVLFTSYDQMRQTSSVVTPILAGAGVHVYEQGSGASPYSLLESFRAADQAILLGTRSFWEGVDIPGEALSVLVITKLPFDVPTDPIVAARSETFEDPFSEYSLPEAILRFRQGFGRLIRNQSDRGVVVVLDRRILTKAYGRAFLESLPPCTRVDGSIHQIPRRTAQWLNL
jgi:DNA polymerase-3 subunit epsilon/ATP-dependent DNA helicase DinG